MCTLQSKRVLTSHLTDDAVEISLILAVDESIVEHPLALVAEETEDLVLVSHLTRHTLQYTWTSKDGKIYGMQNCLQYTCVSKRMGKQIK